jgi:hypothetical protein
MAIIAMINRLWEPQSAVVFCASGKNYQYVNKHEASKAFAEPAVVIVLALLLPFARIKAGQVD